MNWHRIGALVNRHLAITYQEFHRFIDIVYWPFLDIVLWGLTSIWLQGTSHQSLATHMLLTAIVFWQVYSRAEQEMISALLDELWSHNFVNLHSTPLTLGEWIISTILLGAIKSVFTLFFGFGVVWFLAGINILSLGWWTLPLHLLLLISGWAIGCMVSALILIGGHRMQSFIWALDWTIALFSAVYYPLNVLPAWAQAIAGWLPMPALMEAIRSLTEHGMTHAELSVICTHTAGVALLWLIVGIVVLNWAFSYRRVDGLMSLESE